MRLVATWEDPDRPGLPVTLVCAEDPVARANLLRDLRPGAKPRLRLWSGAYPLLRVDLNALGRPRPETLISLEAERVLQPDHYRTAGTDGERAVRVHRDLAADWPVALRAALKMAEARLGRWLPMPAEEAPWPVLAEAWMDDVPIHGTWPARFAQRLAEAEAIELWSDVDLSLIHI